MEPLLMMRLSSSPWLLFLTLLGLTLMLHILFVWLRPLNDVTLKYVDYIWLFAAAIGVLAASAKGGRFIAENQLRYQEPATQNSYDSLRSDIRLFRDIECLPRERSQFSPPDFDGILRSLQQMCQQYKKLDAEMPASVQAPFHPLSELNFHPPIEDPKYLQYVKYDIDRLGQDAASYEKNLALYQQLIKDKNASTWEDAYTATGPLLLAFAVAVRIMKTSGEIMNAKRRANAAST